MSEPVEKKFDPSILPDILPVYYKRIFPHKLFYRWLTYGYSEEAVFRNREISYTLRDDIYIRYLCFESQQEMEKDICSKVPYKIDIGAVMSTRPKNFRMVPMVAVQRELVFDIDMTDYDIVRTCCSGADVCKKCWKFMVVAVRVLEAALRDDFGYKHFLWVFSGRRGVHLWVCDYNARHLNSKGRAAVADYLQLVKHTIFESNSVPRVQIGYKMHHSVKRAFKIIQPMFNEIIIEDQNLFGTTNGLMKLINMIPDEKARTYVRTELCEKYKDDVHSRNVWPAFERCVSAMRNNTANNWNRKMKFIIEEIQIALMYPRLDIHVTKGFNHLLKAPFCIHPSTGKVCIPFRANASTKFDPTTVPNITQLMQEINVFDDKLKDEESASNMSRIKDYKKTSMFKGVIVFEEFLRALETSLKVGPTSISDKKMEF